MYVTAGVAACLLLVWFLYLTRHGGEADGRGAYNRLHRGWRRIAFWAGDICVLNSFPWISWDKHGHAVSEEEWMDAIALSRSGDVLLTTHANYPLSNWAIPGCFKHAGLISKGPECANGVCDIRAAKLIEAISDGVVAWSPMHARADRMILLRPLGMSYSDIARAVCTAERVVGCDYDAGFKFNIEDELKTLGSVSVPSEELVGVAQELKLTAHNVCTEFDMAFSCTETVALAWWHKRAELRLFRRPSRGRNVIVADQFINNGFFVAWTNVTVAEAVKFGLHEEGVELLQTYWDKRPLPAKA
jgi:hypothetical protein